METISGRVAYLVLDACDPATVRSLATHGRCPTLARLLESAAVVETAGPYGTFPSAGWVSVSLARRADQHGYHCWSAIDRATYRHRDTDPRRAEGTPFWEQVSAHGLRVAVLDVPHTALPETPLNGTMLVEWGAHDRHTHTAATPVALLDRLADLVGPHVLGTSPCPAGHTQYSPDDWLFRAGDRRSLTEEMALFKHVLHALEQKRQASLAVLGDEPWDLFVSVASEGHSAGHQLWHVHDESHARHDPAGRILLGDPIAEVYERLDRSLADHLAAVDDDVTVFVHLSHGMGPKHDGDHLLDQVLDRLEQPVPVAERRRRVVAAVVPRLPSLGGWRDRALALVLRRRLNPVPSTPIPAVARRADRRFFQVPNNTPVGAIRLNLMGREATGTVQPAERAEVTAELSAALLSFVNLDTGRPAVQAVVAVEDVHQRTEDDDLPDLFVEWARGCALTRVWSPLTGSVVGEDPSWRSGDHHERGLLLVQGPGVVPGRRPEPMALEDVAPTICAQLGIALHDVDGRPRLDLIDPAARHRSPPSSTDGPPSGSPHRSPRAEGRPLAESAMRLTAELLHRVDDVGGRASQAAEVASTAAESTSRIEHELHHLRTQLESLEREQRLHATMRWLEQAEIPAHDLISVITPTYQRPELLRRAIASVVAQTYQRWEMVVVDDGEDDAEAIVIECADPRVRWMRIPHGGVCAARNAGIDAARGELITYLDDDNQLDPGWLKAVAWAFGERPDRQVAYGARIIDDERRVKRSVGHEWPWVQFTPWDRRALELGNFADMGVIAHRAGTEGARFDEALSEFGDWDFFLSITESVEPFELPAVAVHYSSAGEDRLSGANTPEEAVVRAKHAARRADDVG